MLPRRLLTLIETAYERHPEDARGAALKLTVYADAFQRDLVHGDFIAALRALSRVLYMTIVCCILVGDVEAIAHTALTELEEEEVKA